MFVGHLLRRNFSLQYLRFFAAEFPSFVHFVLRVGFSVSAFHFQRKKGLIFFERVPDTGETHILKIAGIGRCKICDAMSL